MTEAEGPGFVIRDKRGRAEEQSSTVPPVQESQASPSNSSSAETQSSAGDQTQSGPPLNFSTFIFSLGSSALMLMGEPLVPEQQAPPVNLPQAKEIIDILSMLETKTQGNLSTDEKAVLEDMLYTLRMKYVDSASGKQNPVSS